MRRDSISPTIARPSALLAGLAGLLVLFILLALGGCTGFYNDDREPMGETVRSIVAKQTVNPSPEDPTRPVEGLPGPKAESAAQRYYTQGQTTTSTSTSINMDLGKLLDGGSGGGK